MPEAVPDTVSYLVMPVSCTFSVTASSLRFLMVSHGRTGELCPILTYMEWSGGRVGGVPPMGTALRSPVFRSGASRSGTARTKPDRC